VLTHNGTFTISSPKGGHRTFRVRTILDGDLEGKRVLGYLQGPDNERDFFDFAFVFDSGIAVWKKWRKADNRWGISAYPKPGTPASVFEQMAGMFWEVVVARRGSIVDLGYTFEASTVCRVCNRRLTTPASIEVGIGPDCAAKAR
jgi:hypothetical protein